MGKLIHNDTFGNSSSLRPTVAGESLALQIAEALDDRKNLETYLAYCRMYPESLLQKALRQASRVPESKIKKSHAALFKHLVKVYAKQSNHHLGH